MAQDAMDRIVSFNSPGQWRNANYRYAPPSNLRSLSRTGAEASLRHASNTNRNNSLTIDGAGQIVAHDAKGAMPQHCSLLMNWHAEERLTSATAYSTKMSGDNPMDLLETLEMLEYTKE